MHNLSKLHNLHSCVLSGGAPIPAGSSMFTISKICTHMKCNIMGVWEWCIYGLVPMNSRPVAYYHSPPKACFDLRSPALGWLSKYHEYTVAKQNGGGAEWVELLMMLTRGIWEPAYGLLLSLITSWWGICEACSAHPVLKVLLLDTQALYSGDSLMVSILFYVRVTVSEL